jgi:hypothetical protein
MLQSEDESDKVCLRDLRARTVLPTLFSKSRTTELIWEYAKLTAANASGIFLDGIGDALKCICAKKQNQ